MQADFNQVINLTEDGTVYSNEYVVDANTEQVDGVFVVTDLDGTTPVLVITAQVSQDGETWEDRISTDDIDADGTYKRRAIAVYQYVRYKLVLTGTTPSATVSIRAQARSGEDTGLPYTYAPARASIAVTDTPQALFDSAFMCTQVTIKASKDNAEAVYIIEAGGSASDGFDLQPGEAVTLDYTDLSTVYLIGEANDEVALIIKL